MLQTVRRRCRSCFRLNGRLPDGGVTREHPGRESDLSRDECEYNKYSENREERSYGKEMVGRE